LESPQHTVLLKIKNMLIGHEFGANNLE
jgi:hypothetical protein